MNIRIDIYLVLTIIILMLFKQFEAFAIFYIFILLHESAHILTAYLLNIKVIDLNLLPFGANARFDFIGASGDNRKVESKNKIKKHKKNKIKGYKKNKIKGYKKNNINERLIKEIIVAIAGPLFSFLMFIFLDDYKMQNIFILVTNLIPIYPLDGGRIIKNLILLIKGEKSGEKIYRNILKFLIIIFLILNIIIILLLKSYRFVFVSLYIIQMANEELKKEKIMQLIEEIL